MTNITPWILILISLITIFLIYNMVKKEVPLLLKRKRKRAEWEKEKSIKENI